MCRSKRYLLVLLTILAGCLPARAWALSCVSRCGATPCNFASPSSWSCAAVPTAADSCTISAAETMLIQDDGRGCGRTTLNGTLAFDPGPGGRDNDGWRTFTFKAPPAGDTVIFGATGLFIQRQSDRVAFDTTDQTALVNLGFSGQWMAEGAVSPETTVTVVDRGTPTAAQCGQAVGRRYTMTPAIGTALAKPHRRIVFTSGRARNRHFAIATVPSGGSFDVCTDELDEEACTGPGVPYAACTGARVSKNKQRLTPHAPLGGRSTLPVSRHTTPVFSGSSDPTVVPSTGDRAVLIDDAQMFETGGTRGYRFYGPNTGNTVLVTFRAVNFDFVSTDVALGAPFLSVSPLDASSVAPGPFDYLNYHDYPASDGFVLGGFPGIKVRWGAFHDAGANAGESSGTIIAGGSRASLGCSTPPYCPSDQVQITDNVFYRTRGNAMQIGTSATIVVTFEARVNRNMFFDGCTTYSGECGGLELNACQGCEVAHNIGWGLCRGDGEAGPLLALGGGIFGSQGTSVHHNWLVNGCGDGINADGADLDLGHEIGITHNYVSHMKRYGGIGGRWYGNVVKNVGLAGTRAGAGLLNPIRASGNFIEAVDDEVARSSDCDLVGDSGCAASGITYVLGGGNLSRDPVIAMDNIIVGTAPIASSEASGAVTAEASTNFSVTLGHLTLDNRTREAPGLLFKMTRPVSATITLSSIDVLSTHRDDSHAVDCASQPGVTYRVGRIYSTLSGTRSEGGGGIVAACGGTVIRVDDPGFENRAGMDFHFRAGAPGATAGEVPPGSAIGARAFRFSTDRIAGLWGGLPTFDGDLPIDFANGDTDNADSDADGVIDLHDNCKHLFNPSQYDSDADGTGDVCQDIPRRADVVATGSSALRIDGSDLFPLARAFGSCAGEANYDARVDLNPDGCIDGLDLALMASVWGAVLP